MPIGEILEFVLSELLDSDREAAVALRENRDELHAALQRIDDLEDRIASLTNEREDSQASSDLAALLAKYKQPARAPAARPGGRAPQALLDRSSGRSHRNASAPAPSPARVVVFNAPNARAPRRTLLVPAADRSAAVERRATPDSWVREVSWLRAEPPQSRSERAWILAVGARAFGLRVGRSYIVGRGSTADLAVDGLARVRSDTVSRRHAELQVSEVGVAVRDLGSSNGTLLPFGPLKAGAEKTIVAPTQVQFGKVVADLIPLAAVSGARVDCKRCEIAFYVSRSGGRPIACPHCGDALKSNVGRR